MYLSILELSKNFAFMTNGNKSNVCQEKEQYAFFRNVQYCRFDIISCPEAMVIVKYIEEIGRYGCEKFVLV